MYLCTDFTVALNNLGRSEDDMVNIGKNDAFLKKIHGFRPNSRKKS